MQRVTDYMSIGSILLPPDCYHAKVNITMNSDQIIIPTIVMTGR